MEIHIANLVINIIQEPDERLDLILEMLQAQGGQMSDLTDAVDHLTSEVADVTARVQEDVAHLQELLDQALATDAADRAAADALRSEAADTVSRINAATDGLKSIDPLADNPAPEPAPEPAPPAE